MVSSPCPSQGGRRVTRQEHDVPVGGDLKRVSSRVAIRVSADMMPRGHLGPRRCKGKHRIGCWAWEASVATGSCPFAGDTPGKVERAPAAATPAEVGLAQPERRSCGGFEWSRVNSWRGRASERGREQSRSRCTGMLSRRCSVFVRIWLRRKIVQWRFQVPEAKQFGGDQVWATRHGCQRGCETLVAHSRHQSPDNTSRLCRSDPPQGVASRVGSPPFPLIGDVSLDKHPPKL